MTARKHRLPVVFDTNVFVRSFKTRRASSPNRQVVRLWLIERKLQLIASQDVISEYLEIFDEVIEVNAETLAAWRQRFADDARVTVVNLGRRDVASRDPDDNVFLSTARAGKAKYLVTNDRDLLDIPEPIQQRLPFAILPPSEFLQIYDA